MNQILCYGLCQEVIRNKETQIQPIQIQQKEEENKTNLHEIDCILNIQLINNTFYFRVLWNDKRSNLELYEKLKQQQCSPKIEEYCKKC